MAPEESQEKGGNPVLLAAWILTLFSNAVVAFIFYRLKDVRFAVHFDYRGQANGFMYGDQSAYFITGILLIINAALYGSRTIKTGPDYLDKVRIPNREYWVSTPETRLGLGVRLRDFFAIIGIWVNGVFFLTQGFIYEVNQTKNFDPRMTLGFVVGIGLMMVPLLAATFWMFRVPKPDS